MGTCSRIGIKNDDGTITSIYCHWDGYPSHNGKILLENYNTPEKIHELMDLGDLSSLGEEIGSKHDFYERPGDVCTAYGRDRGETEIEARIDKDEKFFWRHGEEYTYLFSDGTWRIRHHGQECELTLLVIEKD